MDFYEKCGGTNEGFFQATSKVLHDAIGRMESTLAYEGFIHADPKELPFFDVPDIFKNVATDKLYHHENDGKMFVPVDMSKANYELERIGNPIRSDVGGQNEFQQKYRCLHCGAIGIVTQIWVKEHDENEV